MDPNQCPSKNNDRPGDLNLEIYIVYIVAQGIFDIGREKVAAVLEGESKYGSKKGKILKSKLTLFHIKVKILIEYPNFQMHERKHNGTQRM